MERGIYFDGWFKHNHCYHPSLPLRSAQMLEDLEKYHGTVLAWAGLGGGRHRSRGSPACRGEHRFRLPGRRQGRIHAALYGNL